MLYPDYWFSLFLIFSKWMWTLNLGKMKGCGEYRTRTDHLDTASIVSK